MTRRFSLKMRQDSYPSLGICIYCTKPFASEQLTDEHIIPKALGGTLIFKKAVCIDCKGITGVHEHEVLKNELLVPRVLLELRPPTAKQRLPLVSFTTDISKIDAVFDIMLPTENYPNIIYSNGIDPPGLLTGKNQSAVYNLYPQIINLHDEKKPFKHQKVAVRQPFQIGTIQHMVAKIAYSYAIAEKGMDYFDSTEIRKILLDESEELFNYVGSAPGKDLRKTKDLH